MSRNSTPYTTKEQQEIVEMYKNGCSAKEISKHMGRSKDSVFYVIECQRKLVGEEALPHKNRWLGRYRKDEVDDIMSMRKSGMKNREIAEKTGRTTDSIGHKICAELKKMRAEIIDGASKERGGEK